MLSKLVKYEIKSTAKIFGMLYGAMALTLVFMAFGSVFLKSFLTTFTALTVMISTGAVLVTYFYTVDLRYKKIYEQEGYLLFTLPVKNHQIVLSQVISSFLWGMATLMITLVYLFIILLISGNGRLQVSEIFRAIGQGITHWGIGNCIWIVLACIVGIMNIILIDFVCQSFTNMPFVRGGKKVITILLFFGILYAQSIVLDIIKTVVFRDVYSLSYGMLGSEQMLSHVAGRGFLLVALGTLFCCLTYGAISFMVDKKLNLE